MLDNTVVVIFGGIAVIAFLIRIGWLGKYRQWFAVNFYISVMLFVTRTCILSFGNNQDSTPSTEENRKALDIITDSRNYLLIYMTISLIVLIIVEVFLPFVSNNFRIVRTPGNLPDKVVRMFREDRGKRQESGESRKKG